MKKIELLSLLRETQDQNILWVYLLKNDNDFNFYISKNKNCSLEILKILSKNKNDLITRGCIIEHPNCSIELLEKLSKDKSFEISLLAKSNKKFIKKISQQNLCLIKQVFTILLFTILFFK